MFVSKAYTRGEHSSVSGLFIGYKEKKFVNTAPNCFAKRQSTLDVPAGTLESFTDLNVTFKCEKHKESK
jgi:hypothetical protein